jgi:hypothetical protein
LKPGNECADGGEQAFAIGCAPLGCDAVPAEFFIKEPREFGWIAAIAEAFDGTVNGGAAFGGAGFGADWIEMLEFQNAARVDGVGIADQCFDLRDADLRQALVSRRTRLHRLDGRDLGGFVELFGVRDVGVG